MTETDRRVRRALDGDIAGLHSRVLPLDDIEILSRAKGGDGRTVVAYAATFGNRAEIHDQDGHYAEQNDPHAFDKTVAERGLRFGVFYHHGRTLHGTPSERGSVPLGRPVLVKPDQRGLLTRTAYNRTSLADEVLESIRNGDPMGMSYTGAFLHSDPPKPPYYARSDGSLTQVTRKEIALIEYGPTPMPAYADAEILGVRAAQQREAERAAMADPVSGRPEGPEPYTRRPGEDVQCPDCGAFNDADANYCDQCGAQLPDSAFADGRQPYDRKPGEDVQCPACSRFNMPDAVYCDQCGAALPPSAYEGSPAMPGGTDAMASAEGDETAGSRASAPEDAGASRAMSTARHEPVTGTHSHAHPAYGSQGGDATHAHEHAHDGDASHAHDHAMAGGDEGTASRSEDPDEALRDHFGWTEEQAAELSDHDRSLLLASITAAHGHPYDRSAAVDGTAWDGNAAMSACKTASDYRAICAGEHTYGDPGERQHWALPHHKQPGAPPNADGVRNSLSRLPQAEQLANRQAAKAHLDAHMKAISPDAATGGDAGSDDSSASGRSTTAPAAGDGTGNRRRVIPGREAPPAEPHPHSADTTTSSTGPHHLHPDGQQHKEGTHVDTTMTVEERGTRQESIRSRMAELDAAHDGTALPDEAQAEWDALSGEYDEHSRAIEEHTRAIAARRERLASLAERQAGERVDGGEAGYEPPAGSTGEGTGTRSRTAPGFVRARTDDDIYDLDAIRQRSRTPEDAVLACRDNAMRAIERAAFPGAESRERAQGTVERLLNSVDDENGTLAKRILATGSPLYMRAWSKAVARLSRDGLSDAESRALAVGVGADGGFAVPFQLDPTVILTSDGAINPLRQISRVQQITGKEYDLVTSAGVTVTRSAEGAAVGDNTPALAQPTIKAERVTGFIPFSVEIEQDWQALQSEMMMLLADAKDIEESSSFTNGNGTAPNAGGIIGTLASGSNVAGTGGAGTLAAGDLYAAEDAMAPRFRPRASWMASKTSFNAYRQLFTQTASAAGDPWVRPSQGTPAELLGYPAYENSDMAATHATGDKPIILGDFGRGFLIIDRLGMSVELVPHLFDQATARPTGSRGLLAIWRNNSMVLVPGAFRVVVVP